jgi:hypothetical protein
MVRLAVKTYLAGVDRNRGAAMLEA